VGLSDDNASVIVSALRLPLISSFDPSFMPKIRSYVARADDWGNMSNQHNKFNGPYIGIWHIHPTGANSEHEMTHTPNGVEFILL